MFRDIESFKIDHKGLLLGVYNRYTKGNVTTWDIRFKKPNSGDVIEPEVTHTLEHFIATYFKNVMSNNVYGVFPMGCGTGFYILTTKETTKRTMLIGLLGAHAYIISSDEVPGATEESCGNYKFHDLEGAKEEIEKFYKDVLVNAEIGIYEDLLRKDTVEDYDIQGEVANDR